MSFNRLPYDTCAYKQVLTETIGPGIYQINRPQVSCEPCFPDDPQIRLQSRGASVSKTTSLIDIDSEMLGITRKNSRCPEKKYLADGRASHNCGAQTGAGAREAWEAMARSGIRNLSENWIPEPGIYPYD